MTIQPLLNSNIEAGISASALLSEMRLGAKSIGAPEMIARDPSPAAQLFGRRAARASRCTSAKRTTAASRGVYFYGTEAVAAERHLRGLKAEELGLQALAKLLARNALAAVSGA